MLQYRPIPLTPGLWLGSLASPPLSALAGQLQALVSISPLLPASCLRPPWVGATVRLDWCQGRAVPIAARQPRVLSYLAALGGDPESPYHLPSQLEGPVHSCPWRVAQEIGRRWR